MFIILEGIDKQGKTSLANHISQKLGLNIVKFSQPKGDPYIDYMNFALKHTEPCIADRYYLGELAYGPVKRGKSQLNEWQVRNIEMLMLMRHALPIYCFTNEENTAKNFIKEKEEYALPEDIKKLLEHFNEAIGTSRLSWYNYNYLEDPNYIEIDKLLDVWFANIQNNLRLLRELIYARTLGDFFSDTLVLGEVSNIDLEREEYKDINVGFANGPSAEILYDSLKYRSFALSNVKKAHLNSTTTYLKEELSMPNLKKVVCLGNAADIILRDYIYEHKIKPSFEIVKTFHPGYALRGGIEIKTYKNLLKKLI